MGAEGQRCVRQWLQLPPSRAPFTPPYPKSIIPEALVATTAPGEPWWGSASRDEVGCAPPIQQATGWGSCFCTPLPKGKVTFGCSQWRVQLHHCPWGWILPASPHPCATVMQLDPFTCWKALACTAVVMLALGSWWDQGLHKAGGEAGAVSHGQGGCWRLSGPRGHHPAVGQACLAPRVGQGLSKDGL